MRLKLDKKKLFYSNGVLSNDRKKLYAYRGSGSFLKKVRFNKIKI